MSKNKFTENHYEESAPTVRKKRKHNVFALVICFLIALIIWVYAVNLENRKNEEMQSAAVSSGDSVTLRVASL